MTSEQAGEHPGEETRGGDARLRLGGMALANGLLVQGPTHWAASVRKSSGEIVTRSGRLPRVSGAVDGMPGLRGVARLGESFAILPVIRARMPEARFPFERASVAMAAAGTTAASLWVRRRKGRRLSSDLTVSLLGMVPALVALRGGNTAAYHGAEHKAIAAYESGGEAEEQTKEHERCGSHLVAPMFISSLAGDALLRKVLKHYSPAAQAAVALAGVAGSVEMFAWAERHPESRLARWFHTPGFELQRLMGTREPTPDQLAVGQAAIDEILRVERR